MTLAFRCGVCKKDLRGMWAVLTARPFPVCSKCRLMVHHGCLAQTDPARLPPLRRRATHRPGSIVAPSALAASTPGTSSLGGCTALGRREFSPYPS